MFWSYIAYLLYKKQKPPTSSVAVDINRQRYVASLDRLLVFNRNASVLNIYGCLESQKITGLDVFDSVFVPTTNRHCLSQNIQTHFEGRQ